MPLLLGGFRKALLAIGEFLEEGREIREGPVLLPRGRCVLY